MKYAVVVALLLCSCAFKGPLARRNYLSQMLYDYRYAQSPEVVAKEIERQTGVRRCTPLGGSKCLYELPWARGGDSGAFLLEGNPTSVLVETTDAGTTVKAFMPTANADPASANFRCYDFELSLLQRLNPQDAARINEGVARAVQRVR